MQSAIHMLETNQFAVDDIDIPSNYTDELNNNLISDTTLERLPISENANNVSKSNILLQLLKHSDLSHQIWTLSALLGGVTILLKGPSDLMSVGDIERDIDGSGTRGRVWSIGSTEKGSPRRCGGQVMCYLYWLFY